MTGLCGWGATGEWRKHSESNAESDLMRINRLAADSVCGAVQVGLDESFTARAVPAPPPN